MKQDIDLKEINENRSKRLKESRIEKGLSITEVSKMIGVNHSTLSRWEAGKTTSMKFDHLQKIADIYGVNPDWLWGYDVSKNVETEEHKDIKEKINDLIDTASDDDLKKIHQVIELFMSNINKKEGSSK